MIFVDRATGSRELYPALASNTVNVSVSLDNLEYGDFVFEGVGEAGPVLVAVERKTLGDLIQSKRTGRFLSHQLPGLLANYDFIYLLIEGQFRPNDDDYIEYFWRGHWCEFKLGHQRFLYREYLDFILSLVHFHAVVPIWTIDQHSTIGMLLDLYRYWQKGWREREFGPVVKQIPLANKVAHLAPPTTLQKVAAQLPGVGIVRSGMVAAHFRTVESMINATVQDWMRAGLGPTTAKKVVKEIHDSSS